MKQYASRLIIAGCLFFLPNLSIAADYSGHWLGTITESVNNCKDLGKAKPGNYKLTIEQEGNDVVIMENIVRRPYTGHFTPEHPQRIHVQGSYSIDGGYVNEMVNIDFEGDAAGKGKSIWRWSDGYFACGGTFSFSLEKLKP